jgi:hypothetical protein
MAAAPDADGSLDAETVRGLFDRAIQHFNEGRYYEAHEDWETLWHDATGPRREWLQGLIQFAAGFHHYVRGGASGFAKLMKTASEKAGGYSGDTAGIDFCGLWARLRPWVEHGARVAKGHDLRSGAPPSLPRIEYRPGVVPAPSPVEVEPDGD